LSPSRCFAGKVVAGIFSTDQATTDAATATLLALYGSDAIEVYPSATPPTTA